MTGILPGGGCPAADKRGAEVAVERSLYLISRMPTGREEQPWGGAGGT